MYQTEQLFTQYKNFPHRETLIKYFVQITYFSRWKYKNKTLESEKKIHVLKALHSKRVFAHWNKIMEGHSYLPKKLTSTSFQFWSYRTLCLPIEVKFKYQRIQIFLFLVRVLLPFQKHHQNNGTSISCFRRRFESEILVIAMNLFYLLVVSVFNKLHPSRWNP